MFFLLSVILVAFSCNEPKIDYLESTAEVKEVLVPSTAKVNEAFSIGLVLYGSSGCSEFSRFETSTVGDTTIFKLYQKRDKNATCTTEIIDLEAAVQLSLKETGTQYWLFNTTTGSEILDSIQITN